MTRLLPLLALTLLLSSACRRAPKTPTPPPAPAPSNQQPLEMPPPPKPQAKPIEEPTIPAQPQPIEPEPTVITPNIIKLPPPPAPKPATRRRPQPAKPKPAETTTPTETTPTEPQPVEPKPAEPEPVLGEVIPEDQLARLQSDYKSNLAAARKALAALRPRRLTRDQSESATRIRAFIRQAEAMHQRDIPAAAELARRAALLAEDLLKSIQ